MAETPRSQVRGSGDNEDGGAGVSVRGSREPKTPAAMLNEICSKGKVVPTHHFSDQDRSRMFKCFMEVTTKFGRKYEAIGIGGSKQLAKHDAARILLAKISDNDYDPGASRDEVDGGGASTMIPPSSGQGNQHAGLEEHMDNLAVSEQLPGLQEPRDIVTEDGIYLTQYPDRVVITVPKKQFNPPAPPGVTQSLQDIRMTVKAWRGPLLEKLKGFPLEKMTLIKATSIAEQIATEQNLDLVYSEAHEKSSVPGNAGRYYCVLEVVQLSGDKQQQQQGPILFTHFGFSETAEETKRIAAEAFLRMLRMLLRS